MTSPNMATITASLERSLQNCTLNQTTSSDTPSGIGISSSSDSPGHHHNSTDATLDLHSQISLPYHWEQCLDLKTGEIYYINWRTGMKAKEDPRTMADFSGGGGDFYSEEDDSSYDSEESSSESSPHVLVVAGCKSCLMYFMVPKQVEDCPKCCGQLLHFDRSENASP
ncbi:hypothetical protein CsSME_00036641 [Camellia sinensis var. sinensis]